MALIAGLTFGIFRTSRVCAVVMLVYFVGSKLFLWVETRSITGLPVALVFTWFFFRGVTGTLVWHRLDREDSRAYTVTAAPVPAPRFRTREEYHAWKEQRELERAGTGRK